MPTCSVRMTLNSRLSKTFPARSKNRARRWAYWQRQRGWLPGAVFLHEAARTNKTYELANRRLGYRPRNSSVTERRENLIIPKTAAAVAATAANASNAR
jgi:hypothetical protein